MSGGDTWIDLPHKLGLPTLQPTKVHLSEVDDPHRTDVLILLKGMRDEFESYQELFHELQTDATADSYNVYGDVSDPCLEVLQEIVDSVDMLALRAKQVHLLYSSKDQAHEASKTINNNHNTQENDILYENGSNDDEITHGEVSAASLQAQARKVLEEATHIVRRREAEYKVHWKRIGAWRENPTVYRYGYLWAVHSLYYWWRDQGMAEAASPQAQHSFCYLNRMDPTEIGYGWGRKTVQFLRDFINKYSPFRMGYPLELINCMSPPSEEYEFPKHLL